MTAGEFERWVRCGLGRAVLWLEEHDDAPHREFLLDLCTFESAFDLQIDGSRAGYVHRLIGRTRVPSVYRERALSSLRETTEAERDDEFRIHLGGWFADAGDREFEEILYGKARRDLPCWDLVVREIAAVFGIRGLIRVAASRPPGRRFPDARFLEYLLEGPEGEEAARAALAAAREAEPALAEMLAGPEADPDPGSGGPRRDDRRPLGATYAEVRLLLAEPGEGSRLRRWDLRRWGAGASEPELLLAAEDLLSRDESEGWAIARGLRIFAERPFPLAPTRLIRWAERIRPVEEMDVSGSATDIATNAATLALRRIRHPLVRELGLRQIRAGLRLDCAASYLVANHEPGDEAILSELVRRDLDPTEYHWLGMEVRDSAELTRSAAAVPSLLALYERGRCGFCRREVLEHLTKRDAVPDWMQKECVHDLASDIREWAATGAWPD